MEFIWRYQAVSQEINGVSEVSVHEVAIDDTTGDILFVLTEDPVELRGDSPEELAHMIKHISLDFREFGVITVTQLNEQVRRANDKLEELFTASNDTATDGTVDSEWGELFNSGESFGELIDDQFDDRGNVLDIVEFMKRNK